MSQGRNDGSNMLSKPWSDYVPDLSKPFNSRTRHWSNVAAALGQSKACLRISVVQPLAKGRMFTVAIIPSLNMIRTQLGGFFDLAEAEQFRFAAQEAVITMGSRSGAFLHLCDVTDLRVQSREIADAFDAFINSPRAKSARLAIVAGQASVRLQVRRLIKRADARLFVDNASAMTWLTPGIVAKNDLGANGAGCVATGPAGRTHTRVALVRERLPV